MPEEGQFIARKYDQATGCMVDVTVPSDTRTIKITAEIGPLEGECEHEVYAEVVFDKYVEGLLLNGSLMDVLCEPLFEVMRGRMESKEGA